MADVTGNTLTWSRGVCDTAAMSDILTIRVPAGEKARWERAAAEVKESVAEYVRKAVRQRAQTGGHSPWEKHFGSADVAVAPPTNANIRRAFAQRRASKPVGASPRTQGPPTPTPRPRGPRVARPEA